jgi:hypothetical protein
MARNGKKPKEPDVVVRWRQLEASSFDIEESARDIASTVLGHMQRSGKAPELLAPSVSNAADWRTAQAAEPLTYREAPQRIAAIRWVGGEGATLEAVTETGEVVELKRKPGRSETRSRSIACVDSEVKPTRRRPMAINRRPGSGGLNRSSRSIIDPTEGLEEHGEVRWSSAPGGANILIQVLRAKC